MLKFLRKVSFVYMADTPWVGNEANKLYVQSGQFDSALKTSYDVTSIDDSPSGITWDGTDTPWSGNQADKLYRQSGQFESVIKDSEDVSSIETGVSGISYDGTDTPWVGYIDRKLYLQSGQFTSTLKTSRYITTVDTAPLDISFDGTNTPWIGSEAKKLYHQSGQFESTIKDSEYIGDIDVTPRGISWDSTNTPWCGSDSDKLYLQSGQFTSTLKTSKSITSIDNSPEGICTNDVNGRLTSVTVYEKSRSNTITFSQGVSQSGSIFNRSLSNTVTFSQNVDPDAIYSRSVSSTITFGQDKRVFSGKIDITQNIVLGQSVSQTGSIFNLLISNTITFGQDIYDFTGKIDTTQSLIFGHAHLVIKVVGSVSRICRQNLARWIFASTSKYFSNIATNNNLHYFVEGTHRETKDYQKSIEFRMDGPNITEISKNYYHLDVEINLLWSFNQDNENFHETERIKGILMDAMDNICIYKFGDGSHDDDSFLGTLQLKQNPVRVNNFGQVREDVRLMQGTVEGSYSMYHTC